MEETEKCIVELVRRLEDGEAFPHEIGLFPDCPFSALPLSANSGISPAPPIYFLYPQLPFIGSCSRGNWLQGGSCRKVGRNGFIERDILGLFLPNVLVHIFL